MNILIVNDNPNQLFSLCVDLNAKGHSSIIVQSGGEVLEILNGDESRFDVVLADYALPDMTGLSLLSHIRKQHPLLPIILMAAPGTKELSIGALKVRKAGFVEKPVVLAELMFQIERALALSRQKKLIDELTKALQDQIASVNDKLTFINGNNGGERLGAEAGDDRPVEDQLRDIAFLVHEIGVANEEMIKKTLAFRGVTERGKII